jgi:integral membrane protein
MKNHPPKIFYTFLRIGHIEGISYLVLLLIAMPLKYMAGIPMAVQVVGYLHGFLFISYCILLAIIMQKMNWSFLKGFYAFVLSLVPFGTFWLHKFK